MNLPSLKLIVIDDDPIFRMGLSAALASYNDLQIIVQEDNTINALTSLTEQLPDLVILDLAVNDGAGWQLCQQLKQNYPQIPILLLTSIENPQLLLAAKNLGVEGYCAKGVAIGSLVTVLRQVATGELVWQTLTLPPNLSSIPRQQQQKWLSRLHQSGVQQIDTTLEQVRQRLKNIPISLFDQLFWQGRQRELLAARWLVNQLLPVEVILLPSQTATNQLTNNAEISISNNFGLSYTASSHFDQSSKIPPILTSTLAKIQSSVTNLTGIALEIEILQPEKQKELLYLVLNQIQKTLEELRFLEVKNSELPLRQELLLRDIWQTSTISFFTKYYQPYREGTDYQIVNILLNDAEIIQAEILNKIPFISELFGYLLEQQSLIIDEVEYRPNAPEVQARSAQILDNLTIQVANAVMQVILNNFADLELLKQNLFKVSKISTREIARFRNNLSWQYRQYKYWQEPKYIFESNYRLFYFSEVGISKIFIYAPRQTELKELQGIPLAVTLLLEFRDAIAPRLRSLIRFIGTGLVYLLTQVIGKGLGLIGRGILQGIGSSLPENRYEKK